MKALHFSGRRILRAIHAAVVALFLAAQIAAHAQTAAGDGHGNVTITGSGGATFIFSPTSTPPLSAGGTLTVANGANLTSSSGFYELQSYSPATLINNGTVSMSNSGNSTANGIYFVPLSSGDVTVTNSATGTITGVSNTNSYARGVWDYYQSGSGNFELTNSGVISADSAGNLALGVVAHVGSGSTTLVNNAGATISAVSSNSNYGDAVYLTADSGPVTLSNAGTISGTGGSDPGIGIQVASGGGNISITNSGLIEAQLQSSTDTGSLYGLQVRQTVTGLTTLSNTGTITADGTTGSAYGISYQTSGTGAARISNTGAIDASGGQHATGISVGGSGPATITTSGPGSIMAATPHGSTYGIRVSSTGSVVVNNSESITAATDTGYAAAVWINGSESVALTNTGTLTSTSTTSGLSVGLLTNANAVTIDNRGQIIAASSNNTGSGIYAITGSEGFRLTNSGSISGAAGAPTGSGVTVLGGGTVSNTGTISADYIGVDMRAPSTVTNSGSGVISSALAAIVVPSGSTVNLEGHSITQGLLYGGQDATSTSVLNFDLTVPTAQLSADKTALNAAIATYAGDVSAAGPGDSVTSPVVAINGVDYQWENFGHVLDRLNTGRLYAETPGYEGIGSAIDHFNVNTPQAAAILGALGNLATPGLANALAQLSPQALGVLRNIAFDGAGFTVANVNDHLANQRDGLTGFDTSGFAINAAGVDPVLTQMRSHLLAWNPSPAASDRLSDSPAALFGGDAKEMQPEAGAPPVDRWSSFISGSVILANLDNTFANTGNADYTTGSVLAGTDYRLDDRFTVGALFDYAHTSADLDGNGSKATVDSYVPGVYGSYVAGPWYGNAVVAYGFNSNTEDREVTIPGIKGENRGAADGGQVISDLTGGYEFHRGTFKFGPVASLQYVHLHVDSFQEDGPASLTTGGQDDDSLRTQLGFDVRYSTRSNTSWGPMTFTPHLQASWQHECLDNSDGITAAFNTAGGGSFITPGAAPERDSAFIDVGLDAGVTDNLTLFVDYQTQAGQDHSLAQSAQGGVRVGF